MKTLLVLVGLGLLFTLSWPIALLVLALWPIAWLISLPFRVLGVALDSVFALLRAILFFPARLLGYRSTSARA